MALNPSASFPTQTTAPSAGYPYGSAQDITVSGDNTGTPWRKLLVDDIFGFQQALLDAAGIVPSGSPDSVLASDYLDALNILIAAGGSYGNIFEGANPDLTDSNAALLTIGAAPDNDPDTDQHIEYGPSIIQSKSNATTAAEIRINSLGGDIRLGNTGSSTLSSILIDADSDLISLRADDVGIGRSGESYISVSTAVGVQLTHAGSLLCARTLAPTAGGLQLNNTLTGAGWERALTVGDKGLSAAAQATYSSLSNHTIMSRAVKAGVTYRVEFFVVGVMNTAVVTDYLVCDFYMPTASNYAFEGRSTAVGDIFGYSASGTLFTNNMVIDNTTRGLIRAIGTVRCTNNGTLEVRMGCSNGTTFDINIGHLQVIAIG